MKAILISIKPKWCALIMNRDKTIEIRKGTALYKAIQKLIDEYGYADIYVYCTKDIRNGLYWAKKWVCVNQKNTIPSIRNGKVLFKFRCYKVEKIKFTETEWKGTKETPALQVLDKSCLSLEEITIYLKSKNGIGCAIHISDLEIFDKPKELSEFYRIVLVNKSEGYKKPLTKAPQSFCYIEVEE